VTLPLLFLMQSTYPPPSIARPAVESSASAEREHTRRNSWGSIQVMANLEEAGQLDWVTALFDVLFLRFANFPLAHIFHKAKSYDRRVDDERYASTVRYGEQKL